MDADAIRAYAARNWDRIRRRKRAHWADTFRREGWLAAAEAAWALFAHMRLVDPDFPSPAARRRDLEHHIALKQALERASHVVADR